MSKRAVLIGINYFGTDSELSGCISDIKRMHEYLKPNYSHFEVLHDGKQEDFPAVSIADVKQPTADNIRDALKRNVAACKPGDTLFVHISSHGSNIADNNGDEKDGMDECIVPVDFDFNKPDYGMIRDDEMRKMLCSRTDIVLRLVVDACHSSSSCDLPYTYKYLTSCSTESAPLAMNAIAVAGCRDDQTSADATIGGLPSGALTWGLLKTLGEIKKAKLKNPKIKYTWKELIDLVRYKLKKAGYEQIPQLSLCKKEDLKKIVDI